MILFPAIDILEGRAVRLLYGQKQNVTDYGDPVERAKEWIDCGAEILHVVNLSGAFGEKTDFLHILERISALGIPVQTGGGIRSEAAIRDCFSAGAARLVLGTVCLEDPQLFRTAIDSYGSAIVAGIDARDGKIALRGWTQISEADAFEFGTSAYALGVRDTVFTDIARDGALSGVNVTATVKMAETGLNVIASGGIRDMADLRALKERGVYGAILGRAIYTGNLSLREAIEETKC